jgi:hypothetical protein
MDVRTLTQEARIYLPSLRCVLQHWCEEDGRQFYASRKTTVLSSYSYFQKIGFETWYMQVADGSLLGERPLGGIEVLLLAGLCPSEKRMQEYILKPLRQSIERTPFNVVLASVFYLNHVPEFIWRFTELLMIQPNMLTNTGAEVLRRVLQIHADTKEGGACTLCGERGLQNPRAQKDWRPAGSVSPITEASNVVA